MKNAVAYLDKANKKIREEVMGKGKMTGIEILFMNKPSPNC